MNEQGENGSAAAAILAAGFGCFVLGMLSCIADVLPKTKPVFTFYTPTGPLSGVTTLAIAAWLIAWAILSRAWGGKTVAIAKTSTIAFVLLALGFLLTFPPFVDLFPSK